MAIWTQKINPTDKSLECAVKLPAKLPREGRLEIHRTTDPNLPYEVRVIRIQEPNEQELKRAYLFAKIIVENHTGSQGFNLLIGTESGSSGRWLPLPGRVDGGIVREITTGPINGTTHVFVGKQDAVPTISASNGVANSRSTSFIEKIGAWLSYFFSQLAKLFCWRARA